MNRRVALFLVFVTAMLFGSWLLLAPAPLIKVGMTEAEMERVLGEKLLEDGLHVSAPIPMTVKFGGAVMRSVRVVYSLAFST